VKRLEVTILKEGFYGRFIETSRIDCENIDEYENYALFHGLKLDPVQSSSTKLVFVEKK